MCLRYAFSQSTYFYLKLTTACLFLALASTMTHSAAWTNRSPWAMWLSSPQRKVLFSSPLMAFTWYRSWSWATFWTTIKWITLVWTAPFGVALTWSARRYVTWRRSSPTKTSAFTTQTPSLFIFSVAFFALSSLSSRVLGNIASNRLTQLWLIWIRWRMPLIL